MVAQSAKDDSATGPLQHHQFETPVDCNHDVAMFSMPASPHDRDVMHKARGVSSKYRLITSNHSSTVPSFEPLYKVAREQSWY